MSTITKEITLTPEEIWQTIRQCGRIEVTEEQLARAQKGARLLVDLAQSVKGKWKGDKSAVEEVHHARKKERGY